MKERFKRYLEREFRAIAPSKAAMEFRQEMLEKLLDRCQELRIKGIGDEELIYDMCIDELGDFRATLLRFQNKKAKVNQEKRKAKFMSILAIGFLLVLTCTYLIVSFAVPGIWGTSWLIMVGGIFAVICTVACSIAAINFSKKKYLISRAALIISEVLISVLIFLLLQLVFQLPMSWLAFLAMVIIIIGVDTLIAMFTESKIRFIELAVFMEVFSVLLYVILGVTKLAPWHPTWLLCLAGVVGIIIEVVVLIARHSAKIDKQEAAEMISRGAKDDDFYTMWKD